MLHNVFDRSVFAGALPLTTMCTFCGGVQWYQRDAHRSYQCEVCGHYTAVEYVAADVTGIEYGANGSPDTAPAVAAICKRLDEMVEERLSPDRDFDAWSDAMEADYDDWRDTIECALRW